MAFAVGKQFVILLNMSKTNPEAQKLLDDLDNISQEDFNQRFGKLLGNSKSEDKEPEVGDVDDLMLDAATDNLIENKDKTVDNPLENVKPIDAETSFSQPDGVKQQTKSALEGIKGMDYEPVKTIYQYKDKVVNKLDSFQQNYANDVEINIENSINRSTNPNSRRPRDENDKSINELFNSPEIEQFIEDVIDNDAGGLFNHSKEYYEKMSDETGSGDSGGLRNQFLETFMKDVYEPPEVIDYNKFREMTVLAKVKPKVFYRGVGTSNSVKSTLTKKQPYYMYAGAKGDGIYMSDWSSVAKDYAGGNPYQIMKFVPKPGFKTVRHAILEKIGNMMIKKLEQKRNSLIDNVKNGTFESGEKMLESIKKSENLDAFINLMGSSQYTALAHMLGYDAVEYGFQQKGLQNDKFSNYIFLSLKNLYTYDITEWGVDEEI